MALPALFAAMAMAIRRPIVVVLHQSGGIPTGARMDAHPDAELVERAPFALNPPDEGVAESQMATTGSRVPLSSPSRMTVGADQTAPVADRVLAEA